MLLLALVFELLVPYSTQALNTEAKCGADVSLPCSASFSTHNFFSVTWYKNNKEGIIRKVLKDNKIGLYNFPRNVSLNEDNSLLLPKVTPEDSGKYECAISANVGGQNHNLHVTLTVPECDPDTTPSLTTLASATGGRTYGKETQSGGAVQMPLVWTLVGYAAVGITKIILSMMIIWIFHICSRRKGRW